MGHLAGAPSSWGVEDHRNPDNTPWRIFLDELCESGLTATELGPYGYLPLQPEILNAELARRDLQVCAGTLYDDMLRDDVGHRQRLERVVRDTCTLLSQIQTPPGTPQRYQAPYLVVIDGVRSERRNFAGKPGSAPRLPEDEYRRLFANMRHYAKIASEEFGIRSVLHHHAGGWCEFADEMERGAQMIPYDEMGFCLDTGHLFYSGMDPAEYIGKYSALMDYVHFKDVDRGVMNSLRNVEIGFFESCAQGLMTPIGGGSLDYSAIKGALREAGYDGWITLEQERDPRETVDVLECLRKSVAYLGGLGF